MTHRPFTRRRFHRAAFSRPRFHRAAFSRPRFHRAAPLWLGLGAITMVIALAWRPFGALGTAGVSATAP